MTVEARDSGGGPAKTNTATTRLVVKWVDNNIISIVSFVLFNPLKKQQWSLSVSVVAEGLRARLGSSGVFKPWLRFPVINFLSSLVTVARGGICFRGNCFSCIWMFQHSSITIIAALRMWTTSHQYSNGKPTRASWPRTSLDSGITCRF